VQKSLKLKSDPFISAANSVKQTGFYDQYGYYHYEPYVPKETNHILIVSNLPFDTKIDYLFQLFSLYGNV